VASSAQPTPGLEKAGMSGRNLVIVLLVPLLLLAGVISLFAFTRGAGLNVTPAVPNEAIQFERTELRRGVIELHIRNTSANDVTISQIGVNDATWPFAMSPAGTIPRLGTTVVTLEYPWVQGEPYDITLFSSNSIAFHTHIDAATTTATISTDTLVSFTLIGVYVGIVPVLLGMVWLPALRRLGRRGMLLLMAATVGLLIYLGIDTAIEAIEQAGGLQGPLQGFGIAAVGFVGTALLLDAISRRQMMAERSESQQRTTLATLIAVGIGLHNLGEGLAIGAAYSLGAAALGTFLVIGFIIQNLTEGLGIVVPLVRERPSLKSLVVLGLIAGGPAIVGTWVGGLFSSPVLSVLFLGVGSGAVFQVAYQIGRRLVWPVEQRRQMPVTAFAGAMAGMLVLYVTGLLVK
jgi:zinc transporter, ZIP family